MKICTLYLINLAALWYLSNAEKLQCIPCISREKYTIKAVVHGSSFDPFWKKMRAAAVQSGRDMGVRFEWIMTDDQDDNTMAREIQNAAASNPDAMIVSVPSETVFDAVDEVVKKGIPVFGVNVGEHVQETKDYLDFVGMDQDVAGEVAAAKMLDIRNDAVGKALFINHDKGNVSYEKRFKGFDKILREKDQTVVVEELVVDPNNMNTAISTKLANCDYDAVILAGYHTMDPAIEAMKVCPGELATFETDDRVMQAIAQQKLAFAVDEQTFLQGALPVVMAAMYASTGKKIVPPLTRTHMYETGPKIITLANLPTDTLQTCEKDGFPICPNENGLDGTKSQCGCTDRSKIKIAGVLHGVTTDEFWNPVYEASRQAARDMGVELILNRPEPVTDQLQLHQRMAQRMGELCRQGHIDGLFVTIPSDTVVDALKECQSLNIPIVSINTGINTAKELELLHHVGMLEYQAGYGAGKRMIDAGMKRGLCLDHEPGNTALRDRCQGFNKAIDEAAADGVTVVGSTGVLNVPMDNKGQYKSLVEAAVNEEGDWNGLGLFLLGPSQVESALLVQESHPKVLMGSVDTSDPMYEAIDEKKILFGIQQGPYMQGYMPIPLLTWFKYTKQKLNNLAIESGPSFVERSPGVAQQACEANFFEVCQPEPPAEALPKLPPITTPSQPETTAQGEAFKPYPLEGSEATPVEAGGGDETDKVVAIVVPVVVVGCVLIFSILFVFLRLQKLSNHIAQLEQAGTEVPTLSIGQKMKAVGQPVSNVVETSIP